MTLLLAQAAEFLDPTLRIEIPSLMGPALLMSAALVAAALILRDERRLK